MAGVRFPLFSLRRISAVTAVATYACTAVRTRLKDTHDLAGCVFLQAMTSNAVVIVLRDYRRWGMKQSDCAKQQPEHQDGRGQALFQRDGTLHRGWHPEFSMSNSLPFVARSVGRLLLVAKGCDSIDRSLQRSPIRLVPRSSPSKAAPAALDAAPCPPRFWESLR